MRKAVKIFTLLFITITLLAISFVSYSESSFAGEQNGLGPAILVVVFFLLALYAAIKLASELLSPS